jgi:hypothetical protein
MTSLLARHTRRSREVDAGPDVPRAAPGRGPWTGWQVVALAGVAAIAAAIRMAGLLGTIGRLDADEAVTGIMAQRILHGDLYAYFAGQNYQGALEQYLQAAVLGVLPSTPTNLRLVEIALCTATCVLVGLVGRQVTGSGWGGVFAAAIYAAGPYYNVYKGIHSHGAYDTAQLVGTASLLVAFGRDRDRPPGRYAALALGVCVGLAVWENSLALFLVVPAVLWAVASARGSLRRLVAPALAGAMLGAAPALGYQLHHGWVLPWQQGLGSSAGSVSGKLHGLVDPVLEMFLGAARPFSGARAADWLPPLVIGIVALGLLLWAVLVRWRGLVDLISFRTRHRAPIDVALAGFLLFGAAYGFSAYTTYTREPRYLFTLYPLLALVLAWGVWRIRGRARGIAAAALVGALLAMTLTTMHTADALGETTGHVGGLPIKTQDMPAVVAELQRLGVRDVYANYWLAYPIAFAADGAVSVAPTGGIVRFPSQARAVAGAADPAYAAPVGPPADQLQAALARSGAHAERIDVRSIAIFVHVTPARRPLQLVDAGL